MTRVAALVMLAACARPAHRELAQPGLVDLWCVPATVRFRREPHAVVGCAATLALCEQARQIASTPTARWGGVLEVGRCARR